jgi:lipopolysaccharide transport system permease protein
MSGPAPEPQWIRLPVTESFGTDIRNIWAQRTLLPGTAALVVRTAYQKTVLGVAWLFIRPLVVAVVATIVFRDALGLEGAGTALPYPIFVLTGFAAWVLFEQGVSWCTRALMRHKAIVRNFSTSHALLLFATSAAAMAQSLAVYLCVIVAAAGWAIADGVWYLPMGWKTLTLLPLLLVLMLTAWGVSLFSSIIYLRVRDTWYVLRYALTALLFLTPVFYSMADLPPRLADLVRLNPLASFFSVYHWATVGGDLPDPRFAFFHLFLVAILFAFGLRYFLRSSSDVMDHL